MTSFQDAPDENIEHDEKMELRSIQLCISHIKILTNIDC